MSMDFIVIALMAISVLTNLTVEGIKKITKNCPANVTAAATAVVLSVGISVVYLIFTGITADAKVIAEIVVLAYLSFLVATNGYDKVMQAITQIRRGKNV